MSGLRPSFAFFGSAIGITLAVLATVGCSGSTDRRVITSSEAAFVPVIESSDIYVGVPRLVLTLLERDTQPHFPEDTAFRIRYFDPTEDGIKFHSEAELREIDVEGLRYLIANEPPFETAGQWALAVTVELPDGTAESTPRLPFLVRVSARGLVPGDQAPQVDTPTTADGVLERMADPEPEALALYERSAWELLSGGEPFLIVWTSAERCAGRRACARALEQASAVLVQGTVEVLHVEPFGRPRPQALQSLIDAANEAWSIEAEPQFYLVDENGVIAARFEIVVEQEALDAAVEALAR